jgi:SAM-dependent methyltransferase
VNLPARRRHPNLRSASATGIVTRARERWDALGKRKNRVIRPRWLALRRTKPLSDIWGADRGTPVDRYYIERFLAENRGFVRGDVLEIKHSMYTDRFGAGVRGRHVLDIDPGNERATIVADLARADSVPDDSFDCFILTQTLQLVYDLRAAVSHCHRILRPGGALLCTVPSVSRIDHGSLENEYWRFTAASCRRLFGEAFDGGEIAVTSHGNVLSSIAFMAGIAAEELRRGQLDRRDEHFPMLLSVRARKRLRQP